MAETSGLPGESETDSALDASHVAGSHLSKTPFEHSLSGTKTYPYLLRNLDVDHPDQVWCADITYIRMQKGFVYLVAIMDWFSRYVLAWELSIMMDVAFCINALKSFSNHRYIHYFVLKIPICI